MPLRCRVSGTYTTFEDVEEIISDSLDPLAKELFIENLKGTCIEKDSDPLALSDNGKRRLYGHDIEFVVYNC